MIDYVRKDIPAVTLKPCEGETYTDTVPDTFDVAGRAELGINVLTRATNPHEKGRPVHSPLVTAQDPQRPRLFRGDGLRVWFSQKSGTSATLDCKTIPLRGSSAAFIDNQRHRRH